MKTGAAFIVKRYGPPIGRADGKTITVAGYAYTVDEAVETARRLMTHPSYPPSAFWVERRGHRASRARHRVDSGDRRSRKYAPYRQPPRA